MDAPAPFDPNTRLIKSDDTNWSCPNCQRTHFQPIRVERIEDEVIGPLWRLLGIAGLNSGLNGEQDWRMALLGKRFAERLSNFQGGEINKMRNRMLQLTEAIKEKRIQAMGAAIDNANRALESFIQQNVIQRKKIDQFVIDLALPENILIKIPFYLSRDSRKKTGRPQILMPQRMTQQDERGLNSEPFIASESFLSACTPFIIERMINRD
jgi:hypothetical protein